MFWKLFCILIILCSGITFAEQDVNSAVQEVDSAEKAIKVGLTLDFASKYVWRGQVVNDDFVFQPAISVSYKNLSATIWGNVDLTGYNEQRHEFTETDYTLEYSDNFPFEKIKWLNYSFGVIYYAQHGNENPYTTEIFWGLGIDCFLAPSVKVYHDVGSVKGGTYVAFSVEHSFEKIFEISKDMPVGMDIGASLGWGNKKYNSYYWETEHSSLNDFTLSISFPVEIAGWTFAPSLNYVTLLNGDIRSSGTNSSGNDQFFTVLSISREF